MLTLIGVVVAGLVVANVLLFREHVRLRRRTHRLAKLARDGARRVRSMDWATAAAFEHVHSALAAPARTREAAEPEQTAPRRPTFPN
jgi:hypothetical protein